MARPTFSLADDHARQLIVELAGVEERCPFRPRDHREFVRAFIGYVPDRKPSTATLALEKERFVKQLEQEPAAQHGVSDSGRSSGTLAVEFRRMLDEVVGRPALRASATPDSYLQSQCDFLQQRLSHCEKQLAEARAAAAQIEAQRQVLEALERQAREEIASLRTSGSAMQDRLASLTKAVDDARQFALLAIDEARGETRAWKERFQASEAQSKSQASVTETFRRLAYRQGADIPTSLDGKPT
jgi:hypothetical protein